MFKHPMWQFLLFLLLSEGLLAQVNQFLNASQYTVGASPMAAASGDFNGDGKLDLVVTNKVDGTVSVLLANGDGTFQPQVAYDLSAVPAAVAAADVNGDGYLDVIVALPANSKGDPNDLVAVLFGKGDGTLQPPLYYGVGVGPQFVAVQDLNGDGRPDLVVANTGTDAAPGNNVSVLMNVAGTFPAHVEYSTGNGPASVAIGDFNKDGNPDLAVANSRDGTVSMLLGKSNGTFQSQTVYPVGSDPMAVAAGDFNADGNVDLAVGNFNDSTISILLGKGNGSFKPQVTFATAFGEPYAIVVADFNGDKKLDLAVSNEGEDSISILLGNGDGTFLPHVDYWAGNGPGLLVAGDFNGDSKIDLAVPDDGWASRADNKLTLLLGNGDGAFRSYRLYPAGDTPVAVASGDFNNDGYPDLVAVNSVDSSVSVLLGNGDGTYQSQTTYSVGNNPVAIALGDFDGDGKLDLAVANYGTAKDPGDTISILLGNGDGIFPVQPTYSYTVGVSPFAIAVGDFNKDGKLDLIVSNNGDSTLGTLSGNGDGSFQAQLTSPTPSNPGAFAVGDLNGDGIPDVVVVLPGSKSVAILLGKGDGTFVLKGQAATGNNPVSVAVGDLNGDGKIDVAVANSSDNTVSVLLGNGDGTLQAQVVYPTGLAPSSVIASDFSASGKLDLLVANQQDYTASFFVSNGDGTFQSAITYGLGSMPVAMIAVDLNGDGALDVASADSGGRSVSVLLNARGSKMSLTSSGPNSVYGEAVSLTATLAATLNWQPAPTGSVTFLDGSNVLGDATLSNGVATFSAATLTAGNHTLSAVYSGDSNFQPHRGTSMNQNVNPATTTITLVSSPNPSFPGESVTFSANVVPEVSGTATGTVTFMNGTTQLGSVPLVSGVAKSTISNLTVGSFNITASYGGDANFTGSASPALIQVVHGQDFSMSAPSSTSPSSISAGQSATATITGASLNGFAAAVALTCSVSPAPSRAPTCSLNPASISPSAAGATSTLTVNTTGAIASLTPPALRHDLRPLYALLLPLAGCAFLGIGLTTGGVGRRRLLGFLLAGLMAASLTFQVACGGGTTSSGGGKGTLGTPAGNYTVTVTGTSGSGASVLTHQTTVTIKVQ
jgi:hypothetical protein